MAVRCKNCGAKLDYAEINVFDREGSDYRYRAYFDLEEDHAVVINTAQCWTGYKLDEDERSSTIHCPYCQKFPFYKNEVQVYDVVRIVCFDNEVQEVTPWTE